MNWAPPLARKASLAHRASPQWMAPLLCTQGRWRSHQCDQHTGYRCSGNPSGKGPLQICDWKHNNRKQERRSKIQNKTEFLHLGAILEGGSLPGAVGLELPALCLFLQCWELNPVLSNFLNFETRVWQSC